MKILMIVNGPAYGSDETFNALRLAAALAERDDVQPRVFLMGDASPVPSPARRPRTVTTRSTGMLKTFARHGGQLACCGTCLDARGLTTDHLIDEATRSSMDELAAWVVDSEKVLTF
jgi:uncharacterized protein involved in oxidation of intracellular sulfur